jgi:hypothetical protein
VIQSQIIVDQVDMGYTKCSDATWCEHSMIQAQRETFCDI